MKRLFSLLMFSLLVAISIAAQTQPNILSASPVNLIAIGEKPLEYDLQVAIDQLNRAYSDLNLTLNDFSNLYFVRDVESITTGETSSNINFGESSNYYAFSLTSTNSEELSVSPRLEGTNAYIKYSAYNTEEANPITNFTSIKFCYNTQASASSETIYIVINKDFTDEKQITYELVSIPFTIYKFTTCPTTESRVCKNGTKTIDFEDVLTAANDAHGTQLNINSFPSFILITDLDKITVEDGYIFSTEMDEVQFTDHTPDNNLTFTEVPDGDNANLYPLSFEGQFKSETEMSLGSLYMTLKGQSYHTTNEFYLVGEKDEDNGNEGTFYIFPIKIVTATTMKTCQTITLKAPQGNVATKEITKMLTGESYVLAEMAGGNQGVTVLFVSNLDEVNYTKDRGLSVTSNSSKMSIFGAEDKPTDDYPVYFTYTKSSVNNEGLVSEVEIVNNVFLNLKGSTVVNKKSFYMVLEASGQNNTNYDLEVFPIYTETYNAFQTNSYQGISDENLEKYRYSTSNEPFYIKKSMESEGTFVMTDPVVDFSGLNKEKTSDENGYYDVFEALSTNEDVLAESMFVSKNGAEEYFLTTNEGDVLTIWDEGSIGSYDDNDNVAFNYSLYSQEYSAIEGNNYTSNNKPLQIVKTDNGHAIYSKFDTSIYDDNGQGATKKLTVMLFLDYNPATGKFGIMPYDVTGMTEEDTKNLVNQHNLQLYTVTVMSDNTPHFQPKNDEVTIDNTNQTDSTIFKDATDPYVIEITFDRELAVQKDSADVYKAIDKDGNFVEASELFDIKLADDDAAVTSSAPLRNGLKKLPRLPIVSSTSVKSSGGLTNNVMVIELNDNTSLTSQEAPKRTKTSLKLPRLPVVSSTSVKVSAQAGAFQFASVASSPKRKAASRAAESDFSAAFGFEYYIITQDVTNEPTDPGEGATEAEKEKYNQDLAAYNELLDKVKEVVLNSTTVDINTNEEGIVTFYANSIDTRSTYQLNFYKVSDVDIVDNSGTVTLKKLNGVVSGPMMVMRANESKIPTVTVEKGENPVAITENYLRYCTANDNDPATTTDVIPYLFDRVYPKDVASGTVAENYFFGKSKTSNSEGYEYGPLGFYLLNITKDWQNTRNKGIVYLHNYKRSENSTPARMKIVLEDGKEVLDVPTSIMSAIIDRSYRPTNQYYNVLGQKVGSNYPGIVIRNGKKVIIK